MMTIRSFSLFELKLNIVYTDIIGKKKIIVFSMRGHREFQAGFKQPWRYEDVLYRSLSFIQEYILLFNVSSEFILC